MYKSEPWHRTNMVPLSEYIRIVQAYHSAVKHEGNLEDCDIDLCDRSHAVAFLSSGTFKITENGTTMSF